MTKYRYPDFALTLLLFFIAFLPLQAQQQKPWMFKNEKNGVKVYYRETENIHEVKLITSLQTSLAGLVRLFNEVDQYPVWGYKITESRLLKKVSDTEMYYYSRIDFPWPMNDRDVVMHTKLEQDPISKRIISVSRAAPDFIPAVADVVRIRNANTTWTVHPGQNGWLYVEYVIHSDPGGNLPDWLVNMAIDVGPRETIASMRKRLAQGDYHQTRLAHIKE